MFLSHFKNSTFVTIHDQKGGIYSYTPGAKVPDGHGVFFTANYFKGDDPLRDRLREKNLTQVNALYADFDYKPQKPDFKQFELDIDELPTPTYIVETKNGWHVYWVLETPVAVDDKNRAEVVRQVEGVHRTVVEKYGSDPAATDALRYLRVPGHEHRKDPDNPFMVEVVVDNSDTLYTLDELIEKIGITEKQMFDTESSSAETDLDIREVVIDLWKKQGHEASFNKIGHLIIDGVKTATYLGRTGDGNYIATTSTEYPAKGNAVTYTATHLGISTREAYKYLVDTYGEKAKIKDKVLGSGAFFLDEGEDDGFDMESLMYVETKNGRKYLVNDENLMRIFDHYKVAKFDEFKVRGYVQVDGAWYKRDDGRDSEVYSWLVKRFPFMAGITTARVGQALTYVMYRNRYDSAIDYMELLEWDGTPRLDDWLHKVFYVKNDEYHKTIGSNWIKGMVKRMMVPGSKFDHALIIKGGQSIGKSVAYLALAGDDEHVEFTDLRIKEMQQDIQGKLIVEFAEAAIFKKHDQETIKSVISRQYDTFRIPYERNSRDFPRRCVFAVTANNDDLLKDSTGNRRWWPVVLPFDMQEFPPKRTADVDWLKENRDQLLAEAKHRLALGETYWEVDYDELIENQEFIRTTEEDEELFAGWYRSLSEQKREEGVTIRGAYVGVYKYDNRGEPLDIGSVRIKKADEMRVARILQHLGLIKKHQRFGNAWVPGDHFDPVLLAPLREFLPEDGEL